MLATAEEDLASQRREFLRAAFKRAVDLGEAQPLIIPWRLVGTFVLPVAYLTIPHTRRPWLYKARFAVAATVVALNLDMLRNTSSTNFACAYAVGLLASWGIIWSLTVLIWTRSQFEAERVERRRTRSRATQNGNAPSPIDSNGPEGNGHAPRPGTIRRKSARSAPTPDVDVSKSLEDNFEYFWQAYPADGPWTTRLDWALDLCLSWRGSGWNFAIPAIPSYERPEKPLSGEVTKLDTILPTSRSGFKRYTTRRAFFWTKIAFMTLSYLVLDFCAVAMTKDPYFIFGPGPHSLPAHLDGLHPALLSAWRSGLGLGGIVAALHIVFSFDQLVRCVALGPLLGVRGELWHYPTVFGSFGQVLDKGLAGFWGGWWHQTFRLAFVAPSAWLVRNGHLEAGRPTTKAVAALIAFAQSGFLHACGSITSLPQTRWWQPPLFFLLSCAGVLAQGAFCRAFKARIDAVPRPVRRAANLLFVAAWLHATQPLFLDDLGRSALWLFEPVPISPLRWLGFGHPADSWWRWDRDHFPRWYAGGRWWETGLGL